MKLVLAIIHDDDANKLAGVLNENGFSVTKLASTGGFLRVGNTTMMIGVEEEKLGAVIAIISDTCHAQTQMTVANPPYSAHNAGYVPYPMQVTSGGATIFVLDVEQFHKV